MNTKTVLRPAEVGKVLDVTTMKVISLCNDGTLDYKLTDVQHRLISVESVRRLIINKWKEIDGIESRLNIIVTSGKIRSPI